MNYTEVIDYNFHHLLLFIIYLAKFLESHYSDFNQDDMLEYVYTDEKKGN